MKCLGFIVNPIAGIGGAVGLKGSDGKEVVNKAFSLGAKLISPERAKQFLLELKKLDLKFKLYTGAGLMGEKEAKECELTPTLVFGEEKNETSAEDTKKIALAMKDNNVNLLVFCGGDGTAKDIMDAVNLKVPVLGIPSGVKMHSGVFATNPKVGAKIVKDFFNNQLSLTECEVMDIDEEAFRRGEVSAKLYGYLKVPSEKFFIQQVKSSVPLVESEQENRKAIAKYLIEEMEDDCIYIIGPGSTTKTIFELLNLEKTLLGVDIILNKKVIAKDANEKEILKILSENSKVKIIVTPIGGQGYIFGRGNQQISPTVIKKVGKENIIVIATKSKLQTLNPKRLLVDTGNPELDEELKGYIKVVTDYKEETIIRVE
ncbi:ATP-NAD kinase family protein [Candidatus Bathyarchaeota archaeon]|nr:ATP-NAD kinase family protein [Candidatus Bathyarchaeota archaeon]